MNCYTSLLLHKDQLLSKTRTFYIIIIIIIIIHNRLYNSITHHLCIFYVLLLKWHCDHSLNHAF